MTLRRKYPSKVDSRSVVLTEWLATQGFRPEVEHVKQGPRKVKTIMRLVNFDDKEVHRFMCTFSLSELRSHRWLGTMLHKAHKWVLEGEDSHHRP